MTQAQSTSKEFARTMAARTRERAQLLVSEGRRARTATREHVGETLERRIESVRRAARASGTPSSIAQQLPKT
jgi:hypothetical protein